MTTTRTATVTLVNASTEMILFFIVVSQHTGEIIYSANDQEQCHELIKDLSDEGWVVKEAFYKLSSEDRETELDKAAV